MPKLSAADTLREMSKETPPSCCYICGEDGVSVSQLQKRILKKLTDGDALSYTTFDGQELCEDENQRLAEIKKKYRSKYPNMNDPVIRVVEPIAESEEFDETFSDVPPSQRNKQNTKKKGWFRK